MPSMLLLRNPAVGTFISIIIIIQSSIHICNKSYAARYSIENLLCHTRSEPCMHDLSAVMYHFGRNNNDEFELLCR